MSSILAGVVPAPSDRIRAVASWHSACRQAPLFALALHVTHLIREMKCNSQRCAPTGACRVAQAGAGIVLGRRGDNRTSSAIVSPYVSINHSREIDSWTPPRDSDGSSTHAAINRTSREVKEGDSLLSRIEHAATGALPHNPTRPRWCEEAAGLVLDVQMPSPAQRRDSPRSW